MIFVFDCLQEIELARDRNPREGRVKQGAFTLQQVKRWVLTPDIVCISLRIPNIVLDADSNSGFFG